MCSVSPSLPPSTMIVPGKARGVHVAPAEEVNELVRDHAQPFQPLRPRMIHQDPAAVDFDSR